MGNSLKFPMQISGIGTPVDVAAFSNPDNEAFTRKEKYCYGSAQSPGPSHSNRVVAAHFSGMELPSYRSVRIQTHPKAPTVLLSSSGSHGLHGRHISAPMIQSGCIHRVWFSTNL